MKLPGKINWKRITQLFTAYLAICLLMAWLESWFWPEEPRSAKQIIAKGFFMAIFFVITFEGVLFKNRRKQPPMKHPHEN